ncbi:MAG TPA: DUF1801 domain-containing protein [Polyangiales bacterium]
MSAKKKKPSSAGTAAKAKPSAKGGSPGQGTRKSATKIATKTASKAKKRANADHEAKAPSKPRTSSAKSDASRHIDARIAELGDWRGQSLARMRALLLEADPELIEEVKWGGTPVWSRQGIVCTGETYKKTVKLTFAKGAALPDPARLFNSSLEGNTRRAIDIAEGEKLNASAFKALVKAAVALNLSVKKKG